MRVWRVWDFLERLVETVEVRVWSRVWWAWVWVRRVLRVFWRVVVGVVRVVWVADEDWVFYFYLRYFV